MNISPERVVYLIRISTIKFKNPIAIQDLIKLIKINRANFTFVKRILEQNQIITETNSYGNTKLLNINIKKLDKLIIDTDYYKLITDYIKYKDPLLHQP